MNLWKMGPKTYSRGRFKLRNGGAAPVPEHIFGSEAAHPPHFVITGVLPCIYSHTGQPKLANAGGRWAVGSALPTAPYKHTAGHSNYRSLVLNYKESPISRANEISLGPDPRVKPPA